MTRLTATRTFMRRWGELQRGRNVAPAHSEGKPFLAPLDGFRRGAASTINARTPQNIPAFGVRRPAQDEEVIRKPIQVLEYLGIDRLGIGEGGNEALGAARHGARQMERGSERRAARQDEGVERLQARIHLVDLALQPLDLR